MHKKDYKIIADIIRQIPDTKQRFEVALYAVKKLQDTNPLFDRHKFMDACI